MATRLVQLPNGRVVTVGGRRPPTAGASVRRFSSVLKRLGLSDLPVPPAWEWDPNNPSLHNGEEDIYDNNEIGDCFYAAIGHGLDWVRASSGNPYTPITTAQTIQSYAAATGFDPATGANDNGTVLTQGLAFCQKPGFIGAQPILGYASVDATDLMQVKRAIYLFGFVIGGLCLPPAYMQNLKHWGLAGPGKPEDGHAIAGIAYNSKSVLWNSWGYIIPMDDDAVQYYFAPDQGGELYVAFTPEGINRASGKTANGFTAAQLTQWLAEV